MPTTIGTATSFITFTRASTATRVNASGLIESVATNTPRLDYDPVAVTPRGLLVEAQRTNLSLYSGTFNSLSWGRVASSVSLSSVASPDGTNAYQILEDATSGFHCLDQTITFTAAAHTFSCYFKKLDRDFVFIQENSSGAARRSYFNLTTGAVSLQDAGHTATIVNSGGGWYRCIITFTATAVATIVRVGPTTINGNPVYTGSTSSGVLAFGAQLEAGSFVTSYIPTTTASVTRSTDVASVATSAFPYSATEGTIIFSGNDIPTPVGAAYQFGLSDGTINNSIGLRRNSSNFIIPTVYTGGTLAWFVGITTLSSAGNFKAAIAYKLNDYAASVNSLTPITNTAITVPTMTSLGIGNVAGGTQMNGWINSITYIPRRISNAELQARTAA